MQVLEPMLSGCAESMSDAGCEFEMAIRVTQSADESQNHSRPWTPATPEKQHPWACDYLSFRFVVSAAMLGMNDQILMDCRGWIAEV